jgi:hypothetical protein
LVWGFPDFDACLSNCHFGLLHIPKAFSTVCEKEVHKTHECDSIAIIYYHRL